MKLPFFKTKAARKHFFINLSILILLSAIFLVDIIARDNTLPKDPVTYVAEKPMKVMSRLYIQK